MISAPNLTSKNITEFTPEDTIYIRSGSKDHKALYLCKFVSYDPKKRQVKGTTIAVDSESMTDKGFIARNTELSASLFECALYGANPDNPDRTHYHWFDASGYAFHPEDMNKMNENDMHIPQHESYALVQLSRMHHHARPFFGSNVKSSDTIALRIKRCTHNRNLNNDNYFGGEQIIEVVLTQLQFSEMITTLNYGQGVPCTLTWLNGKRIEDPPFKGKSEIFSQEFDARMHNLTQDIKKTVRQTIEVLNNKPTINKSDREMIIKSIESLCREIDGSVPFVKEQFREEMERITIQAKTEVEGYINYKVNTAGLASLGFMKPDISIENDGNE